MKKVCLLSTGHQPSDERLFEKFSLSLKDNGFEVIIILTTTEYKEVKEGISFDCFSGNSLGFVKKLNGINVRLLKHNPDIIICSQPIPLLIAKVILPSAKIIYDVTEWYPENVTYRLTGLRKFLKRAAFSFFDFMAAALTTGFIFGEVRKSKRYSQFQKPSVVVGYHPVLRYFSDIYKPTDEGNISLLFAGYVSIERGGNNLLKILKEYSLSKHDYKLSLRIAGKFQDHAYENYFKYEVSCLNKVTVEFVTWRPYREMAELYKGIDLFIDLRENNFIYNNSLPIKIFESLAFGVPVLYSNLIVFQEDFPLNEFGYIVNQKNPLEIINLLEKFSINKNELLIKSQAGRQKIEDIYNWETEQGKLIGFLNRFR